MQKEEGEERGGFCELGWAQWGKGRGSLGRGDGGPGGDRGGLGHDG
jgi:hypothetical protein